MKKSVYLILSLIISVAIHLVIYIKVADVKIGLFDYKVVKKEKQKLMRVDMINIRDLEHKNHYSDDPENLQRIIRNNNKKVADIFRKNKLIAKPKLKLKLDPWKRKNRLKPHLDLKPKPAAAPSPEILVVDANTLTTKQLSNIDTFTAVRDRKNIVADKIPSLVNAPELQKAGKRVAYSSIRMSVPDVSPLRLGSLPADLLDENGNPYTAGGRYDPFGRAPSLPGIDSGFTGVGRGQSGGEVVKQMDQLLNIKMVVNRKNDGSGFFRLDISPNVRSESMRAVEKDILFLIDCSTSISTSKLAQFKAATLEALEYLNRRGDRFNVVSFSTHPKGLFETPQPVNEKNIQLAKEYVKKMYRGGMTDVFAGISPYVSIDEKLVKDRPMNIFLMSDGKSTVKDSIKNEKMLREILRINRANVSIYSFSAGKSVNMFLMDFLAYNNRGNSLHEDKLVKFKRSLVRFISSHSDMIVADLQYICTGELAKNIFPKNLPHLYRGETLSIYGSFPAGTTNAAISITGRDAYGKLEEMIFKADFSKCSVTKENLARIWAGKKINHLISIRTITPSAEIQKEIEKLSQKYNLYVPY